ncbi:MAG: gluconate 2-dehydrogenase subunit 3 family protein [Candidatus Binatia bacterium]|nr:gluconate 2-dehydrogenase subunit 3 family protein [Candidatus Binatia bacterium]
MNLSDDERRGLTGLLNEVIPPNPDRGMPGAGDLGLAGIVAVALAKHPVVLDALKAGLATLDRVARGECGDAFSALAPGDRKRILGQVEDAGSVLVPMLAFPTYVAYYEHPEVLVALGREARPPHPKGYELEPFDPRLLESVRSRGRLYREC